MLLLNYKQELVLGLYTTIKLLKDKEEKVNLAELDFSNDQRNLIYAILVKQLLAAVWREEGWNDSLTLLDNLKRVSNPETITRARRKLHELGLIEYSDEADARREKEMIRHIDENSNLEQARFFK